MDLQQTKPKILILGHGEHGKGTVSKLLCDLYGYETCSSSEVAFNHIYPLLKAARGYKSRGEAIKNKKNERILWKESISLLNSPDKSTLSKMILERANIYDGMRCHLEFAASRELFDLIIWVDASDRKPNDSSMSIKYDHKSMWLCDNNGTEDDLLDEVISWRRLTRRSTNGSIKIK